MKKQHIEEDHLYAGFERLMDEAKGEAPEVHERWQALSYGLAGDDEVDALRAEAAESDEAARQWQAYRPVDQSTKLRVLERIQKEMSEPPADDSGDSQSPAQSEPSEARSIGAEPSSSPAAPELEAQEEDDETEGVLPFRRPQRPEAEPDRAHRIRETSPQLRESGADRSRRSGSERSRSERQRSRRFNRVLPSVAALAAAIMALVIWPRSPSTLPNYELSAKSSSQQLRSPAEAVDQELTLSPGDAFELFLVPSVAVGPSLEMATYARRADGLEPLALEAEISDTGSIRIGGTLDPELLAGQENVEVWVVVAARGSLPEADALLNPGTISQDDDAAPSWRLLRCRLNADRQEKPPTQGPSMDGL